MSDTLNTPFVLTPPEVVAAVPEARVAGAVKLPDALREKVETQLGSFVAGLMQGDPHSDAFKSKLDAAFSLGRKEIADSTTLSNRFTKKNFADAGDSPAYQAIAAMRSLFDELNPANQGDLFTPTKILGITVPFAGKLTRYLRRYQSAETQLSAMHGQLLAAKDEIARDVAEMGLTRQQLWTALEKLEGAAHFMRELDVRLGATIDGLRTSEPERARAFEQEVLYYVRQNLGDVLAAQALTINAYNVMGELRKTGRETMNGCDRVSTLGMAALSVAVTLARATGNQIATQQMLSGSKNEIDKLIGATGAALNSHVEQTAKFAGEPMLGVQSLQRMFDQTFDAMDKMERYRSEALVTMQQNNEMIRAQLETARARVEKQHRAGNAATQALEL